MTKRITIALAVFALSCGMLLGQTIKSSIVGRVTDPSGAAVAGAQVTVKSTETGAVRTTVSDANGNYSVLEILAGVYGVTVSKQGFSTFETSGVRVLSSETRRVDAQLPVGSVEQTVNVTAASTPVTTDSMVIGDSISKSQLENLPTELQTIDAFIALTPGVQTTGDATNPQIGGGSHWGSVNFNVNGVSNNDPAQAGGATVQGVGLLVMPPPSSIQELQVQANGMDAKQHGKSSISLVTKAGSNDLHFLLYEYLQNPIFNANSYLNNATGIKRPNNHLNQFGGNVGGPIIKNKLFGFFDYSGFRKRFSNTAQQNYPSAAMRTGDFSALCTTFSSGVCTKGTQLYDPWTGKAFPNNQIPTTMFAPQATALLKYLPLPTDPTSPGLPSEKNNYVESIPILQNVNGIDVRIDYNIRQSDQVFGVYSQHRGTPWNSFANWPSTYGQLRYGYTNHVASLNETHIFNPTTINDFRAGWAKYATKFSGLNQDFDPRSLFPQMPETLFRGLPQMNVTGYGNGGILLHDYGSGEFTPRWDWEFTDNFTHTHGKHTLAFGIDETGYKDEARAGSSTGNPPTGLFAFNGNWTGNKGYPAATNKQSGGNAFADFLLGAINNDQTAWQGAFAKPLYSRNWGVYGQDTWQATSSLTLILGLRWEYQSPWKYRVPETTSFDATNNKLILSESSPTPVLQPNMDAAQFAAYPFETTNSLGLPLYYIQPDYNNIAPRLGFAWRPFHSANTVIRGGYGIYYNFQPANVGSRLDGQNTPWLFSTAQPFTTGRPGAPKTPYLPDYTFANPFGSTTKEVVSPNPTISFLQRDFQNAKIQEWTLTLEHGFGSWVVRTSYIGNHSDHLPYNGGPINVPDVQQPNVPLQKQRPYQPFGAINETRSLGIENFNQLQVGVRRRLLNGFSFQGEYEFTRSLDDVPTSGGPEQPNNPMGDYGNTDGVRRHWFIANYVYQLPFGRGRHWLGSAHGIEDAVLGGWMVSGITTYATGSPFTVTFSQAGTGIVGWLTTRANPVPGVNPYIKQSGHNIIDGVQWFNPDAFTPPAKWDWSGGGRNTLFGPGYVNWDLSAQKSFSLSERLSLKFRADMLNAFNHVNLNNPNASIADTRDGGTPNANSGQITSAQGARIVQFGLTLSY